MFAESDKIINWAELKEKLGLSSLLTEANIDILEEIFNLKRGNSDSKNYIYLYLDELLHSELVEDVSALFSDWQNDIPAGGITYSPLNSWFRLYGFVSDMMKADSDSDLKWLDNNSTGRVLWYKGNLEPGILKRSSRDNPKEEGNDWPWKGNDNWADECGLKTANTLFPIDIVCDNGERYCPVKHEITHLLDNDKPFKLITDLNDDKLENMLVVLFKNIAMPAMEFYYYNGADYDYKPLYDKFYNFLNGESYGIPSEMTYGFGSIPEVNQDNKDGEISQQTQVSFCPYFIIISLKDLIGHVKCIWESSSHPAIKVSQYKQVSYLFNYPNEIHTSQIPSIDFERDYNFHLFDRNNITVNEDSKELLYSVIPVVWDSHSSTVEWKKVYDYEKEPVYYINEGITDTEGNIIDSQKTVVYDGIKYKSNELVRESDILEIKKNTVVPPQPPAEEKPVRMTLQYTINSLWKNLGYTYSTGPQLVVNGVSSGRWMNGKTFIFATDPSTNETVDAVILDDSHHTLWTGNSQIGYDPGGGIYTPTGIDIVFYSGDDRVEIELDGYDPNITYNDTIASGEQYRLTYTLSWKLKMPENWKLSLNQNPVITGGNVEISGGKLESPSVSPNNAMLELGYSGGSTSNEIPVLNLDEFFIYGATSMPYEGNDEPGTMPSVFVAPEIEGGPYIVNWIDNGRNGSQPFYRDAGMGGNPSGLYISPDNRNIHPQIEIRFTKGGIIAVDPTGTQGKIMHSGGDVNGYGTVYIQTTSKNGRNIPMTAVYNNQGFSYSGYEISPEIASDPTDRVIFKYSCGLDYNMYYDGGYFWTIAEGKEEDQQLDLQKEIKYWDTNAKSWTSFPSRKGWLTWTHDWTLSENEK